MKQVKNGTFGFTQIVLTDMQSIHFLSCSIPAQRWCSYTKEHPGLFTSFGQKSLGRTSFSRHIIVASVGRNFRTSIFLLSIGITNWGGRLSTIDLPFKVTCFVKNVNNIFNIKWSWSKLVSSRRSNVPTLLFPFSKSSLPSIERMGDKVRWMDGSQDIRPTDLWPNDVVSALRTHQFYLQNGWFYKCYMSVVDDLAWKISMPGANPIKL
jgi:hypothetical protein